MPRIKRIYSPQAVQSVRESDSARPSASDRGYDRTWRKFASWWLTQEPLCRICKQRGVVSAGALVDHIVPLRAGGKRLSKHNVQTMCRSCHKIKTDEDLRRWPDAQRR
jgi:5-methylcytosine-specific restriction protein A